MNIHWISLRACLALGLPLLAGTAAGDTPQSWAGQTFLADYSRLQAIPSRDGRDFAYIAPGALEQAGRYDQVMLDAPEVFLSPQSPYKGAKPADLAAIAESVRSTAAAALQARGYRIVDAPGPDVLYIRLAVTDLQVAKKSRNLLAYTPIGFVLDTGVKALQQFMSKFNILDMALQGELLDSQSRDLLAEFVILRGKSADLTKPISFDALVTVTNELSQRFACRLDNGHVAADQRIDCTDVLARQARPRVIGN